MTGWREVTDRLASHYRETLAAHGETARGVDWRDDETAVIRYDRMLAVVERGPAQRTDRPSVLDVGCGWGGLLDRAEARGIALDYRGIDVVAEMVDLAARRRPAGAFAVADVFEIGDDAVADYVVCNGILTQKLETSLSEMDEFARALVTRLFELCRVGVAFNVMTSMVNFTVPNLFYKSPVELLAFCQTLTRSFALDHAYPLYEYTVYLYRDGA